MKTSQIYRETRDEFNTKLSVICKAIDKLNEVQISGFNGTFQGLVVDMMMETGKQIDDMTIREIREIICKAESCFYAA